MRQLHESDLLLCRPAFSGNDSWPADWLSSSRSAAALLAAPSARAQGAGEPTGTWLTQAGDARVRVSKCGGGICGVIVGLREPIDPATGKPQVDDKNPNPALQEASDDRPAAVQRHAADRPRQMVGHRSTTPMTARTYASSVSVAGPDTLRVEGCVGALCGGENWTRVGRTRPTLAVIHRLDAYPSLLSNFPKRVDSGHARIRAHAAVAFNAVAADA